MIDLPSSWVWTSSDAVGLLGETTSPEMMAALKNCQHLEVLEPKGQKLSRRPYVAVASLEGVLVNEHLGQATQLLVYGQKDGRIDLIEARQTPESGGGMDRWKELAATLADCRALLVNSTGGNPKKALTASGVEVVECEGLIEEAVSAVFAGKSLNHMAVRPMACGVGCGGNGMGCG